MDNDYISSLSREEKIIFLKIFCKAVNIDGAVDEEEIDFLKNIAVRFGVNKDAIVNIIKSAKQIDCVAEAEKISNRKHALQLVKELCVLANIDDDLHDNELDLIIDCARAMNIEDEKVVLINRYVLDSLVLAKTGRIILEEDDE